MKSAFIWLVFLFAGFYSFSQSTPEKAGELMKAYYDQGKFNGSVLVATANEIVFQKGYGYKNAALKQPNDPNTIFQVGSVTKQFTSTIILQLQEEKKLSVQDKISKYFPNFPRGNDITIEHLVSHTSGIYSYTNDGEFMQKQVSIPHSRDQMMDLFKDKPLNFEPGTKWSYSNSGYSMLGYIIEKVTGKPYEQVVREWILLPLQMSNSSFDFTHLKSPQKAVGYFSMGENPAEAPIVDSTVAYSAGALYSTVTDLYKWDRAIYTNKILNAENWKIAFTPIMSKYGYGWTIDSLLDRQFVAHSGGIHGFSSYIIRFPAEKVVIILLDNKGSALAGIAKDLGAIVFNKPYSVPSSPKETKVEPGILKQYVGEYELNPNFIITIRLDGDKLKAQATGQQEVELYAEKQDLFFLKVIEAKIEFVKDKDGKVEKLILHQGGVDQPAKKIK